MLYDITWAFPPGRMYRGNAISIAAPSKASFLKLHNVIVEVFVNGQLRKSRFAPNCISPYQVWNHLIEIKYRFSPAWKEVVLRLRNVPEELANKIHADTVTRRPRPIRIEPVRWLELA